MNTTSAIRSRLAPTPSGFLHTGNIFNFVLTRLETDKLNGTLLLRIDDADCTRVRDIYIEDIFNVLSWLEMKYDEGPTDIQSFKQEHSQYLRKNNYNHLLQTLAETGLLFACKCSRSALATDENHTHCKHQRIDECGEGYAWRLNTEQAGIVDVNDYRMGLQRVDVHKATPYPVVRKKDGFAAYTICSLSDDVNYGINLIVRGHDLLSQTALQLHVAAVCGLSSFIDTRFFHHRLLSDAEGNKLSKSAGAQGTSLMNTFTRAEIYSLISAELGLEEAATYDELKAHYMKTVGPV